MYKKICLLFLGVLTITGGYLYSQVKETRNSNQLWAGYFNQTRFSKKWGMWADLHLRSKENWVDNLSQGIIRLGITYYITDNTKLTAGYAFVNHFLADNHKNISMPEHRPWQQLQWHTNYPRLRMMQWLRLEERWRRKILNVNLLAAGYNFNFRARYNMMLFFPIGRRKFEPGSFSAAVNDELHINLGKEIVNNYFDQNRFFAGINYHLPGKNILQLGYMNIFQQLAAGNKYRSIHTGRLFFFHNIDLRHKKK